MLYISLQSTWGDFTTLIAPAAIDQFNHNKSKYIMVKVLPSKMALGGASQNLISLNMLFLCMQSFMEKY